MYTGLRAAVVTMRLFYRDEFAIIERKLGLKASTTWHIWNRASKEAGTQDIHDLWWWWSSSSSNVDQI